jgi:hypothetical protein
LYRYGFKGRKKMGSYGPVPSLISTGLKMRGWGGFLVWILYSIISGVGQSDQNNSVKPEPSPNTIAPNRDNRKQSAPSISVSNSSRTEQNVNAAHSRVTSSPTADAVSKTTEIGGLAAQVIEASVNDMATPPRYSSADVPDLKSWTPWAKGFKRAGTIFNYVGKAFGIVSAGNNLIGFINKARGGDPKGALISLGKGAMDLVFLAVKATPFGILSGVGWAVISSYIGD